MKEKSILCLIYYAIIIRLSTTYCVFALGATHILCLVGKQRACHRTFTYYLLDDYGGVKSNNSGLENFQKKVMNNFYTFDVVKIINQQHFKWFIIHRFLKLGFSLTILGIYDLC